MLDRNEILELARAEPGPAISITLPTFRNMPEAQQNPIRFKNLLAKAKSRLDEMEAGAEALKGPFQEAETLIENYEFWQHQSDGLAVFISPDGLRTEKVETELSETVHVGQRYAIKPLLELLGGSQTYFALAASWDSVRLYKAAGGKFREIKNEDLPESLEKFIGMSEVEGNIGFHSTGAGRSNGGSPSAKHHGLGTAPPEELEKVQHSFALQLAKEVDHLLRKASGKQLVLIADERLSGMIGQHAKHDLVRPHETQISPAELKDDDIRQIAAKAVAAASADGEDSPLDSFLAHFRDTSSDRASSDPAEIARAAVESRIAELFVDPGSEVAGRIDRNTGAIDEGAKGDLTEDLARLTLANGGDVHLIHDRDFRLGALYRY